MDTQLFNPFEDRLSRDIRNELSEGFGVALRTGEREKLASVMEKYRRQRLAKRYTAYLEDRCARYEKALAAILPDIADPIRQSMILWDLLLFFEVHEVLEHAWYTAEGRMKLIMQALIRAAGVYIKREYGYQDAASRIAAKAVPVLRDNRALLLSYFDPETLIACLDRPDAPPPRLSRS
jgi:hypothetical protein